MWKFMQFLVIARLAIITTTFITDIAKEVHTFNNLKKRTRYGDVLNVASGGSKAHGPFTDTNTDSFTEIGLSQSNSKAKASDVDFQKNNYFNDMTKIYNDYQSGGKDTAKIYLEQATKDVREMSLERIAQQLLTNPLDIIQFEKYQDLFAEKKQQQVQPFPVSNELAVEFLEQAVTPDKSEKVESLDEFVEKEPEAKKLQETYRDEPTENVMADMFGRFQMVGMLRNYLESAILSPIYEQFLNEDGSLKDNVDFKKSSQVESFKEVELLEEAEKEKPQSLRQETERTETVEIQEDGTLLQNVTSESVPMTTDKQSQSSYSALSDSTSIEGDSEEMKKMREENRSSGRRPFWEYQPSSRQPYNPFYYDRRERRYPRGQPFQDEFFEYASTYPMQSKMVVSAYKPEPNVAGADAEALGDQTFTDTLTEAEADKMSQSQSVSISETTDKKRKICLKYEENCFCNNVDKCVMRKTIDVCKRLDCKKEGFKCPYTYCVKSLCRIYEKHTYKCLDSFCVEYSSEDCQKPKEDYFIRCLEYYYMCKQKQICGEFAEDCIPHCERVCIKYL